MKLSNDDAPAQALRRLIGHIRLMPSSCPPGDVSLHLFAVRERFGLLRKLGVESVWLAHRGARVDSFLLLEVGALTTNRLVALADALPDGSFSQESFFDLMHSQVESHREMDLSWLARTSGLQALIAAQRKIGFLEQSAPCAAGESEIGEARVCAVDCAVYIAFFLEAWWRGHEQP